MLYTVLADVAIQGLRSEGVAKRRIEASLRADALLAEFESQMMTGVAPPVGCDDREEGIFLMGTCVAPLELATLVPELEIDPNATSLLEPTGATEEPRLRRIDVQVSWHEGDRELSVQRTTVAFDTTGLEELFPPPADAPGVAGTEDLPDDLQDQLENSPELDVGAEE
jgi:hypothetical protein